MPVSLNDQSLDAESGAPGATVTASLTLGNDGVLRTSIDNGRGPTVIGSADAWLRAEPATPARCGAFEVRATAG